MGCAVDERVDVGAVLCSGDCESVDNRHIMCINVPVSNLAARRMLATALEIVSRTVSSGVWAAVGIGAGAGCRWEINPHATCGGAQKPMHRP